LTSAEVLEIGFVFSDTSFDVMAFETEINREVATIQYQQEISLKVSSLIIGDNFNFDLALELGKR
jgi:hypothetical protein